MNLSFGPVDILDVDQKRLEFLDSVWLDGNGRVMALTADGFRRTASLSERRAWAARKARYGFPTRELLDWLLSRMNGRTAIEIGAGMGDLGYHLGITMTDSYQQQDNTLLGMAYSTLGQTPTTPPKDVIKLDAVEAVRSMKPQVVIGSWITQRWQEGDKEGNVFGVMEEQIIANCETYIVIGNETVHSRKRIMTSPHQVFKFPWLISRAKDQSLNVIYVWNR